MEVTVSRPGGEKDVRKSREQIILEERVIEVFFLAFLNVVSTAYVCSVSESVCCIAVCVCVFRPCAPLVVADTPHCLLIRWAVCCPCGN